MKEPKNDKNDSEHTLLKPKHEAATLTPPDQPPSQASSEVKRDEAPRPCIKPLKSQLSKSHTAVSVPHLRVPKMEPTQCSDPFMRQRRASTG